MAKGVPRWLKVCGIGCGVLVIIVVAIVVGSALFFRDALRSFETADEAMAELSALHGPIVEFRPAANGAIPRERLEAFLHARESVAPARTETERSLAVLSEEEQDPDSEIRRGAFSRIGAGVGLAHQLAEFSGTHSQALLDTGIGQGEYYYIYALAYYSWLGKSPHDGPSFEVVGENGYFLESLEPRESEDVRARRDEFVRASLNRLLLPILRNQLADLASDVGADTPSEWRARLTAEISALEADPLRLPWEQDLPEIVASSLSPYRDRLEASYSPMCNALEVGVARR